ncbi:MAG: FAD-binding oxidoreductase [Thermanaerothrix sp.]|nr:FAD-binding oxidoreductase [Thermanaerothrix sp.]
MAISPLSTAALTQFQARLTPGCQVITPEDNRYHEARRAWNLAVDQYPALIVIAQTPTNVSDAIRFAGEQHLSVAATGTGHGVIRNADKALLLNTSHLAGVRVDPIAQTAWVGAGTKWETVLSAAQMEGLAPLLGSSPDVGVVGYTLGGGFGWLGRKYGLSTDNVNYFEVVTADGEHIRASATENTDLFWGLRGGGGNFGVITGLEIRLYPVTTVYGGNLYYPMESARAAFARFRDWIANAPNELTASFVLMNFPPLPEVPEVFRGRSFVIIRGCYCGPVEQGEALLRPWREWQPPLVDDFKPMSFAEVATISNDPVDPLPALTSGAWLDHLNDDVIEVLIEHVLPHQGPPLLMFSEIRHAGGAISAVNPATTAYSHREAQYSLQVVAVVPTPEIQASASRYIDQLKQRLTPYLHGGVYLNFLEGDEARERTPQGFSAEAYARLQRLKSKYDPHNMFAFSFVIPPAQ